MRHLFPPDIGPLDDHWIRPLEGVARAIAGVRRYRHFDLDDFMIMAEVVRRPRPDLILYKHYFTRHYLNLDQAGHAYRYVAPRDWRSTRSGRYIAHRDLGTAVDALELWELPWMKPGLEAARYGLDAGERWLLHPEELGDLDEEDLRAGLDRHRAEMCDWTSDENLG